LHLDLLDHLRSWNKKAMWPINWNCPATFCYTQCIPNVIVEEMLASTRRTSPTERLGYERRSYLSRVSCQAIGDIRKSYPEQEDLDVQGAMESPYRRRSHMRKRRRADGRIPELLCRVIQILRARFLLRGVGLSHLENSN
jgi:hypothetical protein